MEKVKSIKVQPYQVCELSVIYKISYPTMKKWLDSIEKSLGGRIGRYYSVKQVKMIFDHFGIPFNYVFSAEDRINF